MLVLLGEKARTMLWNEQTRLVGHTKSVGLDVHMALGFRVCSRVPDVFTNLSQVLLRRIASVPRMLPTMLFTNRIYSRPARLMRSCCLTLLASFRSSLTFRFELAKVVH